MPLIKRNKLKNKQITEVGSNCHVEVKAFVIIEDEN